MLRTTYLWVAVVKSITMPYHEKELLVALLPGLFEYRFISGHYLLCCERKSLLPPEHSVGNGTGIESFRYKTASGSGEMQYM